MDTQVIKTPDIKQDRRDRIDEMATENGPNWEDRFQPGTFGCHELLDRTSLTASLLDRFVLSHPACLLNEEWFTLAERAVSALNELYQKIGATLLDEDRVGSEGPSNEGS